MSDTDNRMLRFSHESLQEEEIALSDTHNIMAYLTKASDYDTPITIEPFTKEKKEFTVYMALRVDVTAIVYAYDSDKAEQTAGEIYAESNGTTIEILGESEDDIENIDVDYNPTIEIDSSEEN